MKRNWEEKEKEDHRQNILYEKVYFQYKKRKTWDFPSVGKTKQQNTKPFSHPSSGFRFILQEEALGEASLTMSHLSQEPGASLGTHIFCFLSSWTKDWEDLFLLHLKPMARTTGQGSEPG